MSTQRLPTAQELREAAQFFAGMGPWSWRIDPITDEFSAFCIGSVGLVPAQPRKGAKPRSGGAGRRRPRAKR